jgi:hypothetical protein
MTLHLFSSDPEALDLGAAPRLALPGRGGVPVGSGFCGIVLDAFDQGEQVVEIDAVDDGGLGGRMTPSRYGAAAAAAPDQGGEARLDP